MDVIINLHGVSGATLGTVVVNSKVSLAEFRSAVAGKLSLPAWHMHFLLGTVQLNHKQPFEGVVENSVPPAALDLTAIFESDRIIAELALEDNLYRCWEHLRQLGDRRRKLVQFYENCNVHSLEQQIEMLDFRIQTTSLSRREEKACVKELEDLKRKLRGYHRLETKHGRLQERLDELSRRYGETRYLSEKLLDELLALQPQQDHSNSRALARLWLVRSTGHIPAFDVLSMPDIRLGRQGECHTIQYSFGPQGPHLWDRNGYDSEEYVWSDADSAKDYVPEAVVHFKSSKSSRKFKGWGLSF
jgi:hypothetical protein